MEKRNLRQIVLEANADGIDLLRRGQSAMAFEQLKFAESVLVANTDTSPEPASSPSCADSDLVALTCSNLGCYYRKAGLPRAALHYLERASYAEQVSVADSQQDATPLATTKMNACAALSGVGRHEEAERLAVQATRLLTPVDRSPTHEECSLLAVACHNLGAEREHLGEWASAAVAYRQGAEVARRALGSRSPLARSLADRCRQALCKAERHPLVPRRPRGIQPMGKRRGRLRVAWPGTCSYSEGFGYSMAGADATVAGQAVGHPCVGSAAKVGEQIVDGHACETSGIRLGEEEPSSAALVNELGGGGNPLEQHYAKAMGDALESADDVGDLRGHMLPQLGGSPAAPSCANGSTGGQARRWTNAQNDQQQQQFQMLQQQHQMTGSPDKCGRLSWGQANGNQEGPAMGRAGTLVGLAANAPPSPGRLSGLAPSTAAQGPVSSSPPTLAPGRRIGGSGQRIASIM